MKQPMIRELRRGSVENCKRHHVKERNGGDSTDSIIDSLKYKYRKNQIAYLSRERHRDRKSDCINNPYRNRDQ